MLTDILPPEVRRACYIAYAVGAVILAAIGIVLNGLDLAPLWYAIARDVWLYLGGSVVGAVAAENVALTPTAPPRHAAE